MKSSSQPDIFAFILAGGIGTRFWPHSTPDLPKQFLSPPIKHLHGKTFLQATFSRCKTFTSSKNIFVITSKRFHRLVKTQIPAISSSQIILEPMARDTAGALALAVAIAKSKSKNFCLVLLPSDHIISPPRGFEKDIRFACKFATTHKAMMMLGIKPTYPATGFGYMQKGKRVSKAGGQHVFKLKKFIEKPNLGRAKRMLSDKSNFFWNSGIFIFDDEAIRENLKKFLPQHFEFSEFFSRNPKSSFARPFSKLPKTSIDVGIMEKTSSPYLIPAGFSWDDVGSWNALEKYLEKNQHNNHSNVTAVMKNSNGNVFLVDKHPGASVIALGINNLYVIQRDGHLLLCHRSHIDLLKEAVQEFYENS